MAQIITEEELNILQRAARAPRRVVGPMEKEPCSICGRSVWVNEEDIEVKCLYCEARFR